jgi:hypothetical protein
MNRHLKSLIATAALPVLFLACGGGGGGTTATPVPPVTPPSSLATGAFARYANFDPASTGTSGLISTHATSHFQSLYLADTIAGSGSITSLGFHYHVNEATALTFPHVTIKLSHSSLATLSSTFTNNLGSGKGGQTTVLSDATVTFPAGSAGSWHEIPLTTPFNYNGVDNLIVEMDLAGLGSGTLHDTVQSSLPYFSTVHTITGAATGITTHWVQAMKFGFAGGDNKVDYAPTYDWNLAPLNTNTIMQKVQMLYDASAIQGSGPLTGIGLQVAQLTAAPRTFTYTLKLGHSTKTDLELTWANNFNAGAPVTAASSAAFTVPAGIPAGAFIWLPLPGGVFTYNGTDNLIVELTIESASGVVRLATHPTTHLNRLWGNSTDPDGDTANSYTHQIALRFHGGPVGVVTDGGNSDARFLPVGTASGIVSLFRATELGTGGTITTVAFRAAHTTVAGSYPSYRMIVGHTSADTLTSITDFISQHTVYSGPYSIPVGVAAGDWVEIPLQTPFAYDGVHNLIIWVGSTTADGTGANSCSFSTADDVRYPSHTGLGTPGATYSGSSALKTDLLLKLHK